MSGFHWTQKGFAGVDQMLPKALVSEENFRITGLQAKLNYNRCLKSNQFNNILNSIQIIFDFRRQLSSEAIFVDHANLDVILIHLPVKALRVKNAVWIASSSSSPSLVSS